MSKLAHILGLTPQEQAELAKTSGRLKTISEFLVDLVKGFEGVEFVKALGESMPWWLQATGESLAEAAPPIKFIATLVQKLSQVRDPDRLAYLACSTAYQRAVEKSLRMKAPSGIPNTSWAPNIDIRTPAEGLSFAGFSLLVPWDHEFIISADKILGEATKALGFTDAEGREILNDVRLRFTAELKALLSHPKTKERFAAFTESLRFGTSEERVHAAWQDHFDYLRYLYEEKPVFGEEKFSLADVYVETECGVLTHKEILEGTSELNSVTGRSGVNPFNEMAGGRTELFAAVMNLISDPEFRDAIVIQGPAGSGKSAFTLRLSVGLLSEGLRPIRIRFRDLSLQYANVNDALPEAVRFFDVENLGDRIPHARPEELFLDRTIFDSTIEFHRAKICPYVLILDGWDEVSVAAQKGFAVRVGEILSQVRDGFLNRPNRPIVRVILTGRPSDAVFSAPFLTKQTRVLTIRPLSPKKLRPYVHRLADLLGSDDSPQLKMSKRFEPILTDYEKSFSAYHVSQHGSFEANAAMSVLGLPLLTHLAMRLMVRWPNSNLQPIVQDPTTLYRHLADLTCEKAGRYGDDAFEPSISYHDLRKLLHETACAMTVFGRDNIPYGELDLRLSALDESLVERVESATKESPVSSLMINFFFKGGRTELGAEFLHKSFREYLFAEAIVESLKEFGRSYYHLNLPPRSNTPYWKDFEASDPRFRFTRRLGQMLAPQWLSTEVCQYLRTLIKWEIRRDGIQNVPLGTPTESLDRAGWECIRETLVDVWDWWADGAHLRQQPRMQGKNIIDWQRAYVDELSKWSMPLYSDPNVLPVAARTTTMDAHIGDAILRLCAIVHHYLAVGADEQAAWDKLSPDDKYKILETKRYQSLGRRNGSWFPRFRPTGDGESYFMNFASRINAAGWHPGELFPSKVFLASVDFSKSTFYMAPFARCDLRGADFSDAKLTGAFFFDFQP